MMIVADRVFVGELLQLAARPRPACCKTPSRCRRLVRCRAGKPRRDKRIKIAEQPLGLSSAAFSMRPVQEEMNFY
jgi:hypothetical protein